MWRKFCTDDNILRGKRHTVRRLKLELKKLLQKAGWKKIDRSGQRSDEWQLLSTHQLFELHEQIREKHKELLEAYNIYVKEFKYQRDKFARSTWEDKQTIDLTWKLLEEFNMKYDEMLKWADNIKDGGSDTNFLKFNEGIHGIRILPSGDSFFRVFVQHDWGKDKGFRSCLCWDYIRFNPIQKIGLEKEKITERDLQKANKFGCPMCNIVTVLTNKLHLDLKKVTLLLRTRSKCLLNTFYLYQAFPKHRTDKTPTPGNYVWEISASLNKKIIGAMGSDAMGEGVDESDMDEYVNDLTSLEKGKMLVVQAEGNGVGKNKREYSVDFKGKSGPIRYREDPFDQRSEVKILDPEQTTIYDLADIECGKILNYQETINVLKSIFGEILSQVGYEIPGDEPSDNPLDDNYDEAYANKMLSRPEKTKTLKPSLNAVKPDIKEAFSTKQNTPPWEDDGFEEVEEKTTQEKRTAIVNNMKSKQQPTKAVEDSSDEDYSWLEEEKEEVPQPVKKRKIY